MLFSSTLSVLNYPGEMAVVRLRCDTRGYSNWRDQYLGDMAIRAHRRELDVADRVAWLRAKVHIGVHMYMYIARRRRPSGVASRKGPLGSGPHPNPGCPSHHITSDALDAAP